MPNTFQNHRRRAVLAAGALLLCAAPLGALAQDKYPSKPVTLVVPQAAGGANDAIARVLGLDDAGRRYVRSLAGLAPGANLDAPVTDVLPAHVQHLLDALGENPAFALTPNWRIAGWNAAYEQLYPNVARTPVDERNLLRLVFTDPAVRTLLADWPETSRRFLGEFRSEAAARLSDPEVRSFVERLRDDSPEFRAGWDRHDVRGFTTRERVFHHPDAGLVRYEHHQLRPSDAPGVQIVAYTPVA